MPGMTKFIPAFFLSLFLWICIWIFVGTCLGCAAHVPEVGIVTAPPPGAALPWVKCSKEGRVVLYAEDVRDYVFSHGIVTVQTRDDKGHPSIVSVYCDYCEFGMGPSNKVPQ